MTSLQSAFVLLPKGHPATTLTVPSLWKPAVLIFAVSFAVAIVVGRFGGRRALLYLGAGFLGLAGLSLFASALLPRYPLRSHSLRCFTLRPRRPGETASRTRH